MDFGAFKEFKTFLDDYFDHSCLINSNDPELPLFRELDKKGIIRLRVLENVGMEGTSEFLHQKMNEYLDQKTDGRVYCFGLRHAKMKRTQVYLNSKKKIYSSIARNR